ncbi:WXG100 family type VII secretion target [Qaidamihabitans albus]|uniref:WXG100 family type VII secretion target n=1 Tax=Qaidamihabitans albus TaxID=2795733 RepID=UPI0018F15D50|nr:type VII secretion target [Qaidamihabitans albus]
MSEGYRVDVEALRRYTDNLGSYQDQTAKFGDLVGKADVGDESWGVIGLFTKSQYTETLGQLTDHLRGMKDGLQSASDKVTKAAETYQGMDDEVARLMRRILDEIGPAGKKGAAHG